jgi:DNA-binding transcriptional regulator YhcF (GntR family)
MGTGDRSSAVSKLTSIPRLGKVEYNKVKKALEGLEKEGFLIKFEDTTFFCASTPN